MDINGNTLWEKRIYKSNLDKTISGSDLIQDPISKKIVLIGVEDYDAGGNGANILIFDSLGVEIKRIGGMPNIGFGKLIQSMDGHFLSGGLKGYPFNLIKGISTSTSLLAKFDINGDFKFLMEYDTITTINNIAHVIEDISGNIITGGSLELAIRYTSGGNSACRIMKHDKNGRLVWKKYFDNYRDNANTDLLLGVRTTSDDQIVFTSVGTTTNTPVTFMFYRTDTTYCDPNAIFCYDYTTVGLHENTLLESEVSIYPNPANTEVTVRLNTLPSFDLSLVDVFGKVLLTKNNNKESAQLQLDNLPKGIYFLQVKTANGMLIKKVIKE